MGKMTRRPVWVVIAIAEATVMLGLLSGCDEGYALAIGLNEVDPAHYGGWNGKLYACERDALDMQAIAANRDFETARLLTTQATRAAVLGKLEELADKLDDGDILVVSYSGHGGQVPDENGDEDDGLDETWCLYDGQLIDDELFAAWMKFKAGVRILVLSDSCHSGTVIKMTREDLASPQEARTNTLHAEWLMHRPVPTLRRESLLNRPAMRNLLQLHPEWRERFIRTPARPATPDLEPAGPQEEDDEEQMILARLVPPRALIASYQENQALYAERGRAAPKEAPELLEACVILISGCEDDQLSAEVGINGLFTLVLKDVWAGGTFTGNHRTFQEAIRQAVKEENPAQEPYLYIASDEGAAEPFIGQKPYTEKRP